MPPHLHPPHLHYLSYISERDSLQRKVSFGRLLFDPVLTCFLLPVRPLAAYFIMNGRIYQSPDLYTVLSNRLVSATRTNVLNNQVESKHAVHVPPLFTILARYPTRSST